MTRKEAISILKYQYDYGQMEQSVHKALGMAISSLETDEAYQLEYEKPTIMDLIKRDDAISAVDVFSNTASVLNLMELPAVDAIPRERIEQIVAEILMKDFDRVTCGEDTLTPSDCVAIIRKYTKEQNNE